MFSLAYVILPFSDTSPAEAIAQTLARFQAGGRGDVPGDWLRFHDRTARLREMHETAVTFSHGFALGGERTYFDSCAVRDEMERRGLERWTVRFADVEPDFHRFVERFAMELERRPVTGGYGRWLNGLGEWDFWDLGDCFHGRITGQSRRRRPTRSKISSGPCLTRAAFETLGEMLCDDEPTPLDVGGDDDLELVSRLLDDARAGEDHAFPGVLVLPPGSIDDGERWLEGWPDDADWKEACETTYARFADHWAAGVAFHH